MMDPARWEADELRRYLAMGLDGVAIQGAAATAGRAIVVGSTGPFAQLAGRRALEAGGSAADAVITTALTQIALAAGSWVSYAGVFMMVHHGAGRTDAISAGFATFADEDDPASIPAPPTPSGRTALVPGFMAGVQAAHDRFGVLPWADLFGPAIHVAEHGFPVGAVRERQFAMRAGVLPATFRARRGEAFRQPELAATLRAVAAEGAGWMYHGPWARQFVDAVRGAGGRVTLDDLSAYRPVCGEAVRGEAFGHGVYTLGEPDRGGLDLVAALRAADGVGDPAQNPAALRDLVGIGRRRTRPGPHSDFVLAVDERGNVAAACHSINTALWGATGLFAGGVSIPDAASFQQAELGRLGPGEHVPFPANPAIVLRDGRPVLASSSIGVGLHPVTLQCLHAILGLGVPLDQAVHRPLFHSADLRAAAEARARARASGSAPPESFLATMADLPTVVEDGFAPEVLRGAEALGLGLDVRPFADPTLPRGYWGGIALDGEGALTGGRTAGTGGVVEAL